MNSSKTHLVVPILFIARGAAWLLNVLGVVPGVDWVWTGGLAVVGILTLVVGGLNKLTVVVGPFLLTASVCSVLRQTGQLSVDKEIPILTMVLGCLLLAVQFLPLPRPECLQSPADQEENGK